MLHLSEREYIYIYIVVFDESSFLYKLSIDFSFVYHICSHSSILVSQSGADDSHSPRQAFSASSIASNSQVRSPSQVTPSLSHIDLLFASPLTHSFLPTPQHD